MLKSEMKTMRTTLFNIKGIVPQGQTVNQACYMEILKLLCEAV